MGGWTKSGVCVCVCVCVCVYMCVCVCNWVGGRLGGLHETEGLGPLCQL